MIGIVMGSASDWDTMQAAARMLEEFGVPYEAKAMSAHRTPDLVAEWAKGAAKRGLKAIIAGAGGAAHLAGVIAAHTTLPVLGVPMRRTPRRWCVFTRPRDAPRTIRSSSTSVRRKRPFHGRARCPRPQDSLQIASGRDRSR